MSDDASSTLRYTVEPADVGVRLQHFLATRLNLSLSQTNRLLDIGAVDVDHWTAKRKHKGYKLTARQVIVVRSFERTESLRAVANAALDVRVIAQDAAAGWVVVNKPAGMPVHPLQADEIDTVLNSLIARYPQMHGVGEGGLRSGVVHRLDIETSGTLLFATRLDMWRRLRAAFAEHRTTKIYRAIVLGRLEGAGSERMLLHVAQHRPAKVRVVDENVPEEQRPPGTRLCDLAWRAVETFAGATLVEINLGTGFLHQIRAMFAQMGHPVAGDGHYRGERHDPTEAARPMLHAGSLKVDEVKAECGDPADFAEVLLRLRDPGTGVPGL